MALTSDNKKKYYCLSLAREGSYYAWYGVRYDDSTVDIRDDQEQYAAKDVIEASEWLMDRCDPSIIYDFCFFEVAITSEMIPIFEQRRPVVHGTLELIDIPTLAGAPFEPFIEAFGPINCVNIKATSDTAHLTDALLGVFLKKKIGSVFLPEHTKCSSVSEDGILRFLFGSEKTDQLRGTRSLRVYGPTISKQFVRHLIESNRESKIESNVILKVAGIPTPIVAEQQLLDFEKHRIDLSNGDYCYRMRFSADVVVLLSPSRGLIEMRRAKCLDSTELSLSELTV